MDIIDKLLKLCFILSILFFVFLLGFLSNDLKLKKIHEGLSFIINDIEARLNINLEKKFIGTIVAYIFIGIISVFGIIIYPLRLIIKN